MEGVLASCGAVAEAVSHDLLLIDSSGGADAWTGMLVRAGWWGYSGSWPRCGLEVTEVSGERVSWRDGVTLGVSISRVSKSWRSAVSVCVGDPGDWGSPVEASIMDPHDSETGVPMH